MLEKSAPISLMPWRGADHAPRDVANHRQRFRVEAANVLVVTGGNSGDRGIHILDLRPLQVLGLHPIAGPAACAGAVITQCAANATVAVTQRESSASIFLAAA